MTTCEEGKMSGKKDDSSHPEFSSDCVERPLRTTRARVLVLQRSGTADRAAGGAAFGLLMPLLVVSRWGFFLREVVNYC